MVDSSFIANPGAVGKVLKALAYDDTDVTVEGPEWNEDLTLLDRFSVLYWNVLPGLDAGFKALSEVLGEGEYLLFEEKTRYGVRKDSTLRVTRVSPTGVLQLDGHHLLEVLRHAESG